MFGLERAHAHISRLVAAQGSAAGARLGRADAVADLAHGVGYCQQLLVGQLHLPHTCVRALAPCVSRVALRMHEVAKAIMSLSTGAVHARELTSSGVWKLSQVTPSVQGGVVKLPPVARHMVQAQQHPGLCAGGGEPPWGLQPTSRNPWPRP